MIKNFLDKISIFPSLLNNVQKLGGFIVFYRYGNEEKYLLLKNRKGAWDFPKGKVRKNESIPNAAKRELFEETGIRDINTIDGYFEKFSYKKKEPIFI